MGRGGEDQKDGLINEVKEEKREVSISHTETKTHEEEKAVVKHSTGEEDEENEQIKNGSPEGEDRSSEKGLWKGRKPSKDRMMLAEVEKMKIEVSHTHLRDANLCR